MHARFDQFRNDVCGTGKSTHSLCNNNMCPAVSVIKIKKNPPLKKDQLPSHYYK